MSATTEVTTSGVELSLSAAEKATGGRLVLPVGRSATETFRGVSIDSRAVPAGAAFVAIRGERFDGHDYLHQAAHHAALLVVQRAPVNSATVPMLLVDDTTHALGALGRAWRDVVAPRVVTITGSVGKTTTKELTRAILATVGATHATPGNFNNEIGLPLTLLSMPRETRFLIAELGMNAPGEIATLVRLARPEVAAITKIAPVHLERLGTIEAVAAAKAELWQELPASAHAISPADEPLLAPFRAQLSAHSLTFGAATDADVCIVDVQPRGAAGTRLTLHLGADLPSLTVALPLVGTHNAENAACAAAIAVALGLPTEAIEAGLSQKPELGHRSTLRSIGPWQVLDDCYNASPWAMRAALDTLVELAAGAPAIAVLGRMLELGEAEAVLHREVGAHAATLPLTALITAGPQAAELARGAVAAGFDATRVHEVADGEAAGDLAARLAGDDAWLLIKGSRGARMEQALEALARNAERKVKAPPKS